MLFIYKFKKVIQMCVGLFFLQNSGPVILAWLSTFNAHWLLLVNIN